MKDLAASSYAGEIQTSNAFARQVGGAGDGDE
jgi:hypothetical protein